MNYQILKLHRKCFGRKSVKLCYEQLKSHNALNPWFVFEYLPGWMVKVAKLPLKKDDKNTRIRFVTELDILFLFFLLFLTQLQLLISVELEILTRLVVTYLHKVNITEGASAQFPI